MPIVPIMTFDELIDFYGSQAEAARRLGLSQPSVFDWKETTIPYDRQCQVQIDSGGKLRARKDDDAREVAKREAAA
jgi:hypothetical protein